MEVMNTMSAYDEPTAANADKITVDYRHMVWYGNYSEQRWQDVITACEEFFRENEKNGNVYRLQAPATNDAEGYREAFSSCYADRTSPEILIHTGRAIPYFGDTYHKSYFGLTDENGAGRGYGGGCVTLNYVDKFQNIQELPLLQIHYRQKDLYIPHTADFYRQYQGLSHFGI